MIRWRTTHNTQQAHYLIVRHKHIFTVCSNKRKTWKLKKHLCVCVLLFQWRLLIKPEGGIFRQHPHNYVLCFLYHCCYGYTCPPHYSGVFKRPKYRFLEKLQAPGRASVSTGNNSDILKFTIPQCYTCFHFQTGSLTVVKENIANTLLSRHKSHEGKPLLLIFTLFPSFIFCKYEAWCRADNLLPVYIWDWRGLD